MTITEALPHLDAGLTIKTAVHKLRKGRVGYEWTKVDGSDIWWLVRCKLEMIDTTNDWEIEETE